MSGEGVPAGVVRTSGDGWGIGLYSHDDRSRFWFRTQVAPEDRPGPVSATGLPKAGPETLVWVGLNPSRSDDNGRNRATLRTVLAWAAREGWSEVLGVNLYAHRETDSRLIRQSLRAGDVEDLVGPGNDELLRHLAGAAEHVLLAWGQHGHLGGRGEEVAGWFPNGYCVGWCGNGQPWHPARKSRNLTFEPYR